MAAAWLNRQYFGMQLNRQFEQPRAIASKFPGRHHYHADLPLADGCETRSLLYRLYHLLNHYNLFGGGYARQSQLVIERLLA